VQPQVSVLSPVRVAAFPRDELSFTVSTTVPYTLHRPIVTDGGSRRLSASRPRDRVAGAMGLHTVRRAVADFAMLRKHIECEFVGSPQLPQLPVSPSGRLFGTRTERERRLRACPDSPDAGRFDESYMEEQRQVAETMLRGAVVLFPTSQALHMFLTTPSEYPSDPAMFKLTGAV
jgi:hypothetical protein